MTSCAVAETTSYIDVVIARGSGQIKFNGNKVSRLFLNCRTSPGMT